MRPSTSGRKPCASRKPNSTPSTSPTTVAAPSSCAIVDAIASGSGCSSSAISAAITSESELDDERLADDLAQLLGVDEVAVVPERDGADAPVVHERLRVLPRVPAGGRVARVADRVLAAQARERAFVEHLRHEPEVAQRGEAAAFADGDACGLLPAMLQRVEAEVREPCDVAARRADAEDTAHQRGTRPTQPTTGVGGIGAPPVSL